MTKNLKKIGGELVRDSRRVRFSAARGVVADLFPFIFQASQRMSTRAISDWLNRKHQIYISAATIAKALRERQKYWAMFFDTIRVSAVSFESAHDVPMEEFLFDREKFERLSKQKPTFYVKDPTDAVQGAGAFFDYQLSHQVLLRDWFELDDATIEMCKEHLSPQIAKHRALYGKGPNRRSVRVRSMKERKREK
jgi:adenylate cyclase